MTAEATFNEKLLEVQKPFLEKVFGRRRQKLAVDFGEFSSLTNQCKLFIITLYKLVISLLREVWANGADD